VKIEVDLERCEGHGQCVMTAPELFDLGDDDTSIVLDVSPAPALQEKARAAALVCPLQAITVSD
jgi:ferredoxin